MVHSAVLSEKGQLVIPKRLRDKYGLAKGSKLVIFDENNKLVIEVADSVVEKLKVLNASQQNASHFTDSAEVQRSNADPATLLKQRDAREIT